VLGALRSGSAPGVSIRLISISNAGLFPIFVMVKAVGLVWFVAFSLKEKLKLAMTIGRGR
jgi:hypothetical protein